MTWTIFVFTGGKNYSWNNLTTIPRYLVVFIPEPYAQARDLFIRKTQDVPENNGFEYKEGLSKNDVWQKARDAWLDDMPFSLEDIMQLDEVVVFDTSVEPEGMKCSSCRQLYPYAEGPNQPDGSFKCYACRNGY